MLYTVYVDSLFGSDTNSGELLSPVSTLSKALSLVYDGGIIVIQTGAGTSYGNHTITKNLTLKSAEDSEPVVGTLLFNSAQGLIEGLSFLNLENGIIATNSELGALVIRDCKFNDVETPITLDSVNYIGIHRNFFKTYQSGIHISSAIEVCASSNVFSNGLRPVYISTIDRLDLWKNTIYGALEIPTGIDPDQNLRIIYKTLSSFDILYKRIQLPGFAMPALDGKYDVAMNIVNGSSFVYDVDFTVVSFGSIVSWDGYKLEGELNVGDLVRVMYSENQDPESGDAIRLLNVGDSNSRVDSNSLSGLVLGGGIEYPIGVGVFYTTPVKIHNNNFDLVDTWWNGPVPPKGETGINNFGETGMYVDPNNDDFRLLPLSPNINRSDIDRWSNIFSEMGIEKIDGHYTGSVTGVRDNVVPFDRDLDYSMFNRGATGLLGVTGSVGAFEYNPHETSMGNYVAEQGYDVAYPGTETGPYATVDRGYLRANGLDLYVDTHAVPMQSFSGAYNIPTDGSRYGRYHSKSIILSNSDLVVGSRTKRDIAYVYPSHTTLETGLVYVSPDGNDFFTGTAGSPYRTVGRAIQDGNKCIIIEPGFYPSFVGETGIRLVGVEKKHTVDFNGILYSNPKEGSWTGIGGYIIMQDSIRLPAISNIQSTFNFNGKVDFKVLASIDSDCNTIKLFNVDNDLFVKLNKSESSITLGYSTGGNTYEIDIPVEGAPIDSLFSDIRVLLSVSSSKFSVKADNVFFSHSYNNMFTGMVDDWKIQLENIGTGTDIISNMYILSDSIVGATGVQDTITSKKFFAITGETGIQA